jgi:hypothetical protein
MRPHYLLALPAAVLLSAAAYAQQAGTPPAPTAAPAAAADAAPAAPMSRHCDKAMHKMGSADKTAMPMMGDDCDKAATANAAKKKAKAKRHDHGQFHKNS